MPPSTPAAVIEAVHHWTGLYLLLAVLLAALTTLGFPLVRHAFGRAAPNGADRGARTVLLLVAAVVAIVAAELFTPIRGWLGITLLAVVLAAGFAAIVRSKRTAALREEAAAEPPEPGMTAGAWCVAVLLGFVAALTAVVAAFLLLGGEGVMETLSVQICAVLAAVVLADLTANLLLRLRSRTRRAELRPRGLTTVLSRRAALGGLALTGLVAASAFAVAVGEYRMTKIAQCYPGRDLAVSHSPDTLALGMIGVVALLTTALGAAGVAAAAARPAIASLDPARDHALRRLSAARTLGAVVAAQVVLVGDLVPGAAYGFLPVDAYLASVALGAMVYIAAASVGAVARLR
jgi:hypothetical protein